MTRYLLKVDGNISGPFSEIALQEMASVRAFKEDALLAQEGTEEWKPVSSFPDLHQACFPKKKSLQFKAKSFEKVEQPASDGPITVDQILAENLSAESKLPGRKFRGARNRRMRDFLVSFILIDGVLGGLWYYLPRNQPTDVAIGSAAVLCTLGLYWFFFHIMDRY